MCGIFAFYGQSLSPEQLQDAFALLQHRGPDRSSFVQLNRGLYFGFHRLAVQDLSDAGQQPFYEVESNSALICNGEIYNVDLLRSTLQYPFQSHSDCEVLLPLTRREGFASAMLQLDAEFALIFYDQKRQQIFAARDPLGIRPLFYGTTEVSGEIAFASEMKALHSICNIVKPFPPGTYFNGSEFISYRSLTQVEPIKNQGLPQIHASIRENLTRAVEKRLHADRELGCLLSGGLDSSLIAALATRLNQGRPLQTYAVGCRVGPIDLKYAAEVAKFIGSDHHEVLFEVDEAITLLEEVIYQLETYDITTIRAGIGMYIVCRAIRELSDVKVLLTGEVSDELFGYKYTDFAPDAAAFQREACKRVEELHYYDVLRADRCISSQGLEARVPFGDLAFIDAVMAIDPELKMNSSGMGKALLRGAFADDNLLPPSILYREKAAFSDAVGHALVDGLRDYAEEVISDGELLKARNSWSDQTLLSKEAVLYRKIFGSFYPNRAGLIPAYWMPNLKWPGCAVDDPSARVLANYGRSGS